MEMKGGGWQNAVIGPVLQCLEAATLGMPFEVGLGYPPAQLSIICVMLDDYLVQVDIRLPITNYQSYTAGPTV